MRPEQHRIWQDEAGSRLWLSGLIAAMQQAGRAEVRRQPVAPETLARMLAQLASTATCQPSQMSTSRH